MVETADQDGTGKDAGGRWGRTPFEPHDLKNEYGTSDGHTSDRLDVTCPACEKEWYPVSSCCVKRGSRIASPFCPECGTDFRADEEDVKAIQSVRLEVRTGAAREELREFIGENPEVGLAEEATIYREVTDGD